MGRVPLVAKHAVQYEPEAPQRITNTSTSALLMTILNMYICRVTETWGTCCCESNPHQHNGPCATLSHAVVPMLHNAGTYLEALVGIDVSCIAMSAVNKGLVACETVRRGGTLNTKGSNEEHLSTAKKICFMVHYIALCWENVRKWASELSFWSTESRVARLKSEQFPHTMSPRYSQ